MRRLLVSLCGLLQACSANSVEPGADPDAATMDSKDGGGPAEDGASDSSMTRPDSAKPAVITTCGELPRPGSWQFISPPEFQTPVNMEAYSVAVSPSNQTVYATAANKTNGGNGGTGVMKSTDCGATWTKASTGKNGDKLATGALWALQIDPHHDDTLYVANGYGDDPTLYKSTNGGTDWEALHPDPGGALANVRNFVQAIAVDPADSAHLAVTFHDDCKPPFNSLCFSQSTDGGATWKVFNGPSSIPMWNITGWLEGAAISIVGPTHYLFTSGAGIWYTADGGEHWAQVVGQYIQGGYNGTNHVAPDGTLYIGGNNLFVSAASPGSTPPFATSNGALAVQPLANSPAATTIIDDGERLFVSLTPSSDKQSFWTAPLASPTQWTKMPDTICSPVSNVCRGSNAMAYDATHHILYSANWGAGLWRMVTR